MFAALTRQAFGTEPAVSGVGRLALAASSAPPDTEPSQPPPVATSPGLQTAEVASDAFVVMVFPVRTMTLGTPKPTSDGLTCTSDGLHAERNLSDEPSASVPVRRFFRPHITPAFAGGAQAATASSRATATRPGVGDHKPSWRDSVRRCAGRFGCC